MKLIGFTWVLSENSATNQINYTKDFEASKLGGMIEWKRVYKFSKKFNTFMFRKKYF